MGENFFPGLVQFFSLFSLFSLVLQASCASWGKSISARLLLGLLLGLLGLPLAGGGSFRRREEQKKTEKRFPFRSFVLSLEDQEEDQEEESFIDIYV
jgi:hypothetical protein